MRRRSTPATMRAGVLKMKLIQIVRRMLKMCPDAWYIFLSAVRLTAFLLLCAFVLLLDWGGSMAAGYTSYMTAMALYETGEAVLLVGVLFSAVIEDVQTDKR